GRTLASSSAPAAFLSAHVCRPACRVPAQGAVTLRFPPHGTLNPSFAARHGASPPGPAQHLTRVWQCEIPRPGARHYYDKNPGRPAVIRDVAPNTHWPEDVHSAADDTHRCWFRPLPGG